MPDVDVVLRNRLLMKDAEEARDAITEKQKREISKLYSDWAKEVGERAEYFKNKTTPSSALAEQQLRILQNQMVETSRQVSNEVNNKITSNMYLMADSVVKSNTKWLESLGFTNLDKINASFTSVPDQQVRRLVTGQVYQSGWSLSKAIWSDNEKALKDIYSIVASGLAQNRPIYEIAKNLESYVNPNRKLNWNLVMEDGRSIYKKSVDYNAQRLARTLVQHSYQSSFVAVTKDNPLITSYRWIANGSRVCPLCMEMDGRIFEKDNLPLDHPNGMCTMEPVIDDNYLDRLANWVTNPEGSDPELDEFAKNFGYNPPPSVLNKSPLKNASTENADGPFKNWSIDDLKKVAKDLPVNQEDSEIGQWVRSFYIDTNQSNVMNAFAREAAKHNMSPLEWLEANKQNYSQGYYEQMKKAFPYLDKAFSSYTLPEGLETHRFVKSDFLDEMFGSRKIKDVKANIGSILENNQYLSSTVTGHDSFGNRSVMLTIQAPSGTKCLPTTNYKEGEVVFNRNYDMEFLAANKYSKKNPKEMTTPSGEKSNFTGLELIVRLVEKGK